MKLTIDRATWINGRIRERLGNYYWPRLLDRHGGRCCLGFYCAALGIPDDQLEGLKRPGDARLVAFNNTLIASGMTARAAHGVHGFNSTWTTTAMRMNDNGNPLDDEERESFIAEHFELVDVEVFFTGEYP